jgi:hypothetical protein
MIDWLTHHFKVNHRSTTGLSWWFIHQIQIVCTGAWLSVVGTFLKCRSGFSGMAKYEVYPDLWRQGNTCDIISVFRVHSTSNDEKSTNDLKVQWLPVKEGKVFLSTSTSKHSYDLCECQKGKCRLWWCIMSHRFKSGQVWAKLVKQIQ